MSDTIPQENQDEPAMQARLITADIPPSDGRYVSGKTLRREYLYEQRKLYLLQHTTFASAADEATHMQQWINDARLIYLQEGDYVVKEVEIDGKKEKKATYLGTF